MKVFLTGGTGFIGQPLTRALLARGWEVVALVRSPDRPPARALTNLGAQCVPGDVTDRESLRAGMAGADLVIHNAAWYELGVSGRAKQQMHAINVTGTENVLGLALELGIARTVYVSSTVYYGDTGTEVRDESYRRQKPYNYYYEQTKAEAHEIALDYLGRGLPVTIVCPASVMGPNDHAVWGYFLRLYLNGLLPPFAWAPDTLNSGVYVDDVAAGIALAAEKGRIGQTYILAGDPISLREILEIWKSKPGRFRVRFYLPVGLVKLMFTPLAPLLRLLGLPAFLSRETAVGGSTPHAFSSTKAQRELGWSYRPAQEMWLAIIDEELKLRAQRRRRDLLSRLKPIETYGH